MIQGTGYQAEHFQRQGLEVHFLRSVRQFSIFQNIYAPKYHWLRLKVQCVCVHVYVCMCVCVCVGGGDFLKAVIDCRQNRFLGVSGLGAEYCPTSERVSGRWFLIPRGVKNP